jgi:hypothetical protein
MDPIIALVFIAFGIGIIVISLKHHFRKKSAKQENIYKDFLDAEREADFARRKDLSPDDYLKVDVNILPVREYPDSPEYNRVTARQNNVIESARLPMICDVRKLSNRELKLKYGMANLDTIVTYEENYDRFIHNLLEWSEALISLGVPADAAAVLEAAIGYRCDRSHAYTTLADMTTERDKLVLLCEKAQSALSGSALERTLAHINHKKGMIE